MAYTPLLSLKTRNFLSSFVLYPNPNPNHKETDMKKLFIQTLFFLPLGICLHASTPPTQEEMDFYYFTVASSYDGPGDETTRLNPWFNSNSQEEMPVMGEKSNWSIMESSLGSLARSASVIGVGTVTGVDETKYILTVEHALVGCTNEVTVTVYVYPFLVEEFKAFPYETWMPKQNSRIVFAAKRGGNHYFQFKNTPQFYDIYANRSWWPVERDNGVLLTQFTNVLHAVRIEPNWTNYFYLCRDGAASPSNRVREDSYMDMRRLVVEATDEQKQFIFADPLVDPEHKIYPNKSYVVVPVTEFAKSNYFAALAELKIELYPQEVPSHEISKKTSLSFWICIILGCVVVFGTCARLCLRPRSNSKK